MERLLRPLARGLLSGIFLFGGSDVLRNPGPRAVRAAKLKIPEPELAVRVNAATMVVAGAALGLGLAPRAAAATLAASLVPTTLAGHRFWEEEDERGRLMQLNQFFKNAGLLGGLLLVVADEG